MTKSAHVKRKFSISACRNENQFGTALGSLNAVSGVINVILDRPRNCILIEYDAVKIGYSGIEKILVDHRVRLATGIKRRWLSIWYDYLDTTARDNALAPPAPCCNKPPVRPK